ncbi:MAG TPA: hypothetical protein VF756_14770, partial [Thermoanaerobaculia bacterium]
MDPDLLVFNGVDADTGDYLRQPVRLGEMARLMKPGPQEGRKSDVREKAPLADIDPRDLAQTGWGVLFGPDATPEIRQALAPLLDHRQAQAGRETERFFRSCDLAPEETYESFRRQYRLGPGPVAPGRMPYYLLLVAGPGSVPFDFQYQLDIQYAVGRIWFDSMEEYAAYAASVVAAETRPAPPSRQAVLFSPVHPDDPLTQLSSAKLVAPLARTLAEKAYGWEVRVRIGEEARKEDLAGLLGGPETPALLFTAGHGIGLRLDDRRQRDLQGALLCQGWGGPKARQISRGDYFSAGDLPEGARLDGLVTFFFACYSAGTPQTDSFAHLDTRRLQEAAREAFLARLPQKLLGRPGGGALAAIGHIDQAWPCSFLWEDEWEHTQVFESALRLLMRGYPIGAAMEHFGQRYAEIAAEISSRLEPVAGAGAGNERALLKLWLAHNDA